MSFDIHPAVFVSVTVFMAVSAWLTFIVTCYLRRRQNRGNDEEKDQKDEHFQGDPTGVVIAHTGTDFRSGDDMRMDDLNPGKDGDTDGNTGGGGGGGDNGGGDSGDTNCGGGGGDTGGTGGRDTGGVTSSGD